MSYRIGQDFAYLGNDYWRWWAWIEGDDPELDRVTEVAWILHPSFPRTRIITRDRSNRFRLETAGWGTFVLRAELTIEAAEKRLLKHNLRLEYPEAEPPLARATRPARPLTLFFSYSAQDTKAAAQVRQSFKKAGFEVLDQTALHAGEPWAETMQRMISRADAVVGFIGEDEISPWVRTEIEAAASSGKPAFLLLAPGSSTVGIPGDVRSFQFDVSNFDPMQIADLLRSAGSD
jgi:hypothetical protein